MPISNFLSGSSIVDAMSSGVRDQGYLYSLQRQLRAEDQKFTFDQQANPMRLDALREDLYKSRLDNQFAEATQQFRVDQVAAQTVILGAKSRYADTNERAGAVSALQAVAVNDQTLALNDLSVQSERFALEEQRQDLRIKYPALNATFAQGRQNLADAGGTLASDQGLPGVISSAAAGASLAAQAENPTLPGNVRNYTSMLYDSASPVPAAARPPGTRQELEAGLGSLSRQLQDFDQQGPVYRQYAATFGNEAAQAQHGALRAARDATDTSLRAMTQMGAGMQRAENATLTQETENVRLRRENEELKLQLSRAAPAGPVAAAPLSSQQPPRALPQISTDVALGLPPVVAPAAPGQRVDPLARPAAEPAAAAPVAAAPAAAPVGASADNVDPPEGMPQAAPTYTPPRAVRGQPKVNGVIYIDPDREEPVIDLGRLNVREGTPAGFDFDDDRDPPTVVAYQRSTDEDGGSSVLPVLSGNASHIFKAMLTQESGNRQVDRNGRPITSSAGAIGIAQVMPATAREQARYAGIPWSEQRYKYDAAYNLSLGQGYYTRMLRMFGGDTVLATAAYNAGPGNVNKAIRILGDPRKGRISHGAWVSRLPSVAAGLKETRDYVRITHGRAARAGKGK